MADLAGAVLTGGRSSRMGRDKALLPWEGRILARYIDVKILDRSPFETIDSPGVGQMVRMGAWLGRKTKADLKLGVCGEHGGDPDSIDFFHNSGLNYVSCSPFRVPVARVAAAQEAIRRGDDVGW